ncbi:MAG: hypothetical protein KF830_13760 [Planctomycetes bacterium]|nr:hypothetical protein [Planctomycetota bacterium]
MTVPSYRWALLVLFAACQKPQPADPQPFLALGIAHARAPEAGLYCSGQPTAEQFARLQEVGVTRVVSLRLPTEEGTGWEEERAQALGLEFVRLPIAGGPDLTVDNAKAMAKHLEGVSGPVLVACGTSNRVGALFALKARFVDGRSPDAALAFGKACGLTKAEPLVQKLLAE